MGYRQTVSPPWPIACIPKFGRTQARRCQQDPDPVPADELQKNLGEKNALVVCRIDRVHSFYHRLFFVGRNIAVLLNSAQYPPMLLTGVQRFASLTTERSQPIVDAPLFDSCLMPPAGAGKIRAAQC